MLSHVAATQVDSSGRTLNRETLVDGTGMRAPITDIKDHSSGESTSVQTQDRGRMEEKLRHLEVLKENLRCLDSIADRVVRWLCQKHWVFSRVDLELVEDMPPNSLHVLPVLHDSVLHRVRQLQDATEFLGLLSNVAFLLISGEHDSFVLGASHIVVKDQ